MEVQSEEYLKIIMGQQLRLSLLLFAVFFLILFGLPLMNYYLPDITNFRVWGFTVSWLFLGIMFYPLTWLVAYIYVKCSLNLEQVITENTIKGKGGKL
ncbi:hypothetical protein N752_28640 [Desulforamulus aquiferis]|nr:hypothetical protein N752_28640 [Desulforamulus aquiferis]